MFLAPMVVVIVFVNCVLYRIVSDVRLVISILVDIVFLVNSLMITMHVLIVLLNVRLVRILIIVRIVILLMF